jgi:hypothetical protein
MTRSLKLISNLFLLAALGFASSAEAQTKPGPQASPGKLFSGYDTIVVEKVTLDKNPKLDKFPSGQDSDFQKKIVADMQKKKVFPEVIDGTLQAGNQEAGEKTAGEPNSGGQKTAEQKPGGRSATPGRRLILSTTIIDYAPGNKALRYSVGWGMGATKVKARFIFRDAATGQELLEHTQQGKFLGFITKLGTGKSYPVTEASGDIVDGLIREIHKFR